MSYAEKYPKLKNQFFSILYNVFLRGEIQVLSQREVKNRAVANEHV